MTANHDKTYRIPKTWFALALVATACGSHGYGQTNSIDNKPADQKATDIPVIEIKPPQAKSGDSKSRVEIYKVFYLTNITQQNDLNDVQTALRNLIPPARLFAVPSQEAIVMRATAEELQLAQQAITDLDKTKKVYRLTYTVTESDEGKRVGVQHYSMIVASGSKTNLKQGSKVPILTGTGAASPASQVTYIDVGLDIEAELDSYFDGVRLRSKIGQSSVAEEKSGAAMSSGDPVVRQTVLEGTSTLLQGKPQVLGSLDIPGSTRHQEIEVVSELVR